METAAMTNAQMYFAIAVPTFAVIMGLTMNIIVLVWQARGIEKRIDRIEDRLDKMERTLEVIQSDLKQFYSGIARLKERSGL